MSDKTFLGKNAVDLDIGKSLMPVSRVNILVDIENYFTAGDDTGRTIEKTCPWGSQAMADSILAALKNVNYLPYTAKTAIIDPAIEIGDGITTSGIYSVVANKNISFNSLLTADVSAPGGDEIDEEYPYITRAERESKLKLAQIRSYIEKKSDEIKIGVESLVDERYAEIDVQLGSIKGTVQGLNGKVGTLELTAESLTGRVEDGEGRIGELELTVDSLKFEITSPSGAVAGLRASVRTLDSELDDLSGEVGTLQAAVTGPGGIVSGLSAKVTTLDGKVGDLSGEVGELTDAVTGPNGAFAGFEASVSDLHNEVTDLDTKISKMKIRVTGELGEEASITLTTDSTGTNTGKLDLSDVRQKWANDKTNVTIQGGTLTFNGGGCTFNNNTFVVNSDNFEVTKEGYLTVNRAILNGAYFRKQLTTHTFLTRNDLAGSFNGNIYLENDHEDGGAYSSKTIYGVTDHSSSVAHPYEVALLYASGNYNGNIPSAVLGYDNYNNIGARINGRAISSQTTIVPDSDRDLKKDIADLPEGFTKLFDGMRPVTYRYNWQEDGEPVHWGYIAQEMEEAIFSAGMTREDVAALVGEDGSGQMGIGYTELIPLMHMKIRQQDRRMYDFEQRLARLEAMA